MNVSTATCLAAFAAALLPSHAMAQSSGHFDFLTYNVAGLPAIINGNDVPGNKKTNSRLIGTALGQEGHDIVHMQEDFAYHSHIYEADTHPYRTPTSGTVIFGDGLNTLSHYDYTELKRTKWKKCSLNSGDCLTPKGFTFMRMTMDDFELHLYNLHADAGSKSGDISARSASIDQILEAIGQNSNGYPIIIAGDFNDRWTNSGASVNKLTDAGFTDAWVETIKDGIYPVRGSPPNACSNPAPSNDCEIVDKIFYRSGDSVTLAATFFDYVSEDFLQPGGSILSDHNPVHVDFEWSWA